LRRAEDLYFRAGHAIGREAGADGAEGEVGGVAIARKMAKDRPAQAVAGERGEDLRGGGIGEMAVARHDALLDGPWTAAVLLEQFFVVIGLDNHGRGGAQALVDELGGEPEIGAKPEARAAMMQHVADRVRRIVRHGEGLHHDIADREIRARLEEAKILAALLAAGSPQGIRGEGIAINGGLKFFAEDIEPGGVVDVLVRDKNAVDGGGRDGGRIEPRANLPGTQAAIDQEPAGGGLHQRAIPRAAGAEDGHCEHHKINAPTDG